jgi:hypothetical protein
VAFDASPGVTYYLVIGSVSSSPGGLPSRIDLSVRQAPAPPDNDRIEHARPIAALPFSDMLETGYATTSPGDPYCFGQAASVWYSFTPADDVRVELSTLGSNYGTSVSVYTGASGSLVQLACNASGMTAGGRVRFAAQAGTTYLIMIAGTFIGGGSLSFSAVEGPPAPDNDEIEHSRSIGAIPFSDTQDTTDATSASDDPFCYGQGPTVWYSFTPTTDVRVELNTFGSSYGATLSVYTGARGSLSQLACNAFSQGQGARVRFLAQANVTYQVMVGSYFNLAGGTLVLSAVPAPPPFTFDFQTDPQGSVVPSTGTATIRGTATCSQPAFVYVSGALRQDRPGNPIDAFVYTAFFCDGTTAWSAPVFYSPRLFRGRSVALFVGGWADATLSAAAFSASEGESRFLSRMSRVLLSGSPSK